jgi:hypothetical protein
MNDVSVFGNKRVCLSVSVTSKLSYICEQG